MNEDPAAVPSRKVTAISARDRLRRSCRSVWERRFWFPLTPLGAIVVGVAFWLYRYARQEKDFVLMAGASIVVALITVALLAVLGGVLLLYLRLPRGALRDLALESGVRAATGYRFPKLVIWPMVSVRIDWTVPERVEVTTAALAAQEGASAIARDVAAMTGGDGNELDPRGRRGRAQEVVRPLSRGDHTAVRRRFIVADIFGFTRFAVYQRSAQRVRVIPGEAKLSGHVVTHIVGGEALSHPTGPPEGELLDMRRYAYGDPLRHVIWKAFARTRQLLVRCPERAIAPSPSATAYFVAGPDDEPSASAARYFVEHGLLGDEFLFLADGAHEPVSDAEAALDQIIGSAAHRDHGAERLSAFVDRAAERRRGGLVLFLPPTLGPWLARVEQLAGRLGGASVFIGVDGDLQPARGGRLRRLLFTTPGGVKRATSLPRVVGRLARCGLEIKVIHRPSGELVPTATILEAGKIGVTP